MNRSTNRNTHCVKSVRIRCFSDPHFLEIWLNTERCELCFRIHSECGKIRTRKAPSAYVFHVMARNTITTKMHVQMRHLRHFSVGFHKSSSFLLTFHIHFYHHVYWRQLQKELGFLLKKFSSKLSDARN